MPQTDAVPGSTPEAPLYFRFLRDDQDNIQWGKVVVALALSVLSAYLATQAQRSGSGPDQMKAIKMKYHRAVNELAIGQAKFWSKVADNAATRYDIARL
jgi:hypothetical protein